MRSLTVLLGGLLVLIACAGGGGVTTRNELYVKEMRHYLSSAKSVGAMPVVISHNPFADDLAGTAIVSILRDTQVTDPRLDFAASSGTTGYRIVLAFGEPPIGNGHYCATPTLDPRPTPASRTVIHAMFCSGNSRLSEAVAETAVVRSPQDPHFARLIRDLMSALLPANHPNSYYDFDAP